VREREGGRETAAVRRPVLKLINGPGKINGAENTTSPALISRGKVATGGWAEGGERFSGSACGKKSFQLRFSPSATYVAQIVMRL